LLGLNIVAFVVSMALGLTNVNDHYGMWPIGIALNHEYYRLFTSMFLHASLTHIAFNMLVLWIVGQQLESLIGHTRFVTLYLLSGLAGATASYWFGPVNALAVGASGAIFGLMGGLLIAGRRLRYDVTQIAVLIGINIVFSFLWPGVDWRAHLGGLVGGVILGFVFAHAPKKNRLLFEIALCLLFSAVLVGAIGLRSHQIAISPAVTTGTGASAVSTSSR
jgi:membrane associated rhomboid family serine protease